MSMQLQTQSPTAAVPLTKGEHITQNQHLRNAYADYMNARQQVKDGLLGNAMISRERLRAMYRLLAGKPL